MKSLVSRLAAVTATALLGTGLALAPAVPASAADDQAKLIDKQIGGRFLLRTHEGEIVSDQHFRGKFMLVYFGYTFCPDICPTSLGIMAEALDILEADLGAAKAKRVAPVFITVDPARDTAERLRDYVGNFHPRLIGLTGPKQMTDRVAKSYNVKYEKVLAAADDPDNYTIDHSAGTFLMAPNGEFLVKFAHGMAPEKMAARIEDFLKQAKAAE